MIAVKFTIELDIGLSFLLQAALPRLVTDRETKTHRRGRSQRCFLGRWLGDRPRAAQPTVLLLLELARPDRPARVIGIR
jgi:hypothetical protein